MKLTMTTRSRTDQHLSHFLSVKYQSVNYKTVPERSAPLPRSGPLGSLGQDYLAWPCIIYSAGILVGDRRRLGYWMTVLSSFFATVRRIFVFNGHTQSNVCGPGTYKTPAHLLLSAILDCISPSHTQHRLGYYCR